MDCSASRKKKCLTVHNLSIKLYRIYVCYMTITLYHAIYSVRYYPRFSVTAVGLGTYYPWIRRSTCICISFPAVRDWWYFLYIFFCTQTGSRTVVSRGPVARLCAVLQELSPRFWSPCLVSPCTAIQKHTLTLSKFNWIICRPFNTD